MQPFNASNLPGTCPWCGRKLSTTRPWSEYPPFDTLRCALAFARRAHEVGYRFQPKAKEATDAHPA